MIAKFSRTPRRPLLATAILAVLGLIALTDAQNKSEGGRPLPPPDEKTATAPSKDSPLAPQVTGAGATEKAPPGGESDTIVDPKTGLKFTVAKRITGGNDWIVHDKKLSMSPNGKFLLWWGKVFPLDGSKPFPLEGMGEVGDAAWSPDGTLIAYRPRESIWVLPVSPETGQSTGPSRKLADDNARWSLYAMEWTPDSLQIRLDYRDPDGFAHLTCLSVPDGKPVPSPEVPGPATDYTRFGLRSPDGQWVAFSRYHYLGGVWVVPSAGGPPRFGARLSPTSREGKRVPLWWSPDGQWLLCKPDPLSPWQPGLVFARLRDHFVCNLEVPASVGKSMGLSPDGKRLLFYNNSYAWQSAIKTVAVRGGVPAGLTTSKQSGVIHKLCCPDGKWWCYVLYSHGRQSLMVAPFGGGEPVEVKINASRGDPWVEASLVSPDGKRLFFPVRKEPKQGVYLCDGYVIGLSLNGAETTGDPVLMFKGWGFYGAFPSPVAWSHDSARLLIRDSAEAGKEGDLWVVPTDGGPPRQLTHTPDPPVATPTFSPDGRTVAYTVYSLDKITLYTVSSDGGTPRALWTSDCKYVGQYAWFPDSKEIAVPSSDAVVAVSVADGTTRPVLKLTDTGFEWLLWMEWSPDGRTLGLFGVKANGDADIVLFHAPDAKIEKLPGGSDSPAWTPDGQAIGYVAGGYDRAQLAGVIYGLDVEEALQKVVAGAPPVQDKPLAALDLTAPPLVNGEYADHFDGPLAPCWKVVEQEKQATHVHKAQNGELVLENGAAILGGCDWTNYVFKVRMCAKSPMSRYTTLPGVVFRRNANGAYYLELSPHHSVREFGILFGVPANERHAPAAVSAAHDLAFDTWYDIEVEVKGSRIKASVDGKLAFELDDATFSQGAVELRAEGCRVHFDDFSVRQLP